MRDFSSPAPFLELLFTLIHFFVLCKSRNTQFKPFKISALSSGNHGRPWNELDVLPSIMLAPYIYVFSARVATRGDADNHKATSGHYWLFKFWLNCMCTHVPKNYFKNILNSWSLIDYSIVVLSKNYMNKYSHNNKFIK